MALSNNYSFNGMNFNRVPGRSLNEGVFHNTATSLNVPHRLTVRSNMNPSGVSQVTLVNSLHRDADPMQPNAKDDVASVQISFRGDLRRFTPAELDTLRQDIGAFLASDPYLVDQLFRGEV